MRDMANKLLAKPRGDPVGKNWPDAFINRVPGLKRNGLAHTTVNKL